MPARPVYSALMKLAKYNGESGTCWNDPSNLERLNDVRELIYEEGDYIGTVEWALYRVQNGYITLPIEVEDVRGVYACNQNVTLQSEFYEFTTKEQCGSLCIINGKFRSLVFRKDPVKSPLFLIPSTKFNLVIYAEDVDDYGKELILEFKRGDLREQQTITLSKEGGRVNGNVTELVAVSKPITKGGLQAVIDCGYGPQIAGFWPAWSESPRYTRLRSVNCPSTCQVVAAFSKKKCRQLTDMNELVEIESLQALIFGYIAKNKENSPQEYAANVQLMNRSLEKADANLTTSEPSEQIRPIYEDRTGP